MPRSTKQKRIEELEQENAILREHILAIRADAEHVARSYEEVCRESKIARDTVSGVLPALAAAGFPVKASIPGGTVQGMKRAVEALVADRARLEDECAQVLKEAEREQKFESEVAQAQTTTLTDIAIEKERRILELQLSSVRAQVTRRNRR